VVLPSRLKKIAVIRNPDVYFVEESTGVELGGIEFTAHSPDGSNAEKRYPFLWIARREGVHAFIASLYSKEGSTGQINRLPARHARRNLNFLEEWRPLQDTESTVRQIVPVRASSMREKHAPEKLQGLLLDWESLGAFFAHALASSVLKGDAAAAGRKELNDFRDHFVTFVDSGSVEL
jgi:hypothetical protein